MTPHKHSIHTIGIAAPAWEVWIGLGPYAVIICIFTLNRTSSQQVRIGLQA